MKAHEPSPSCCMELRSSSHKLLRHLERVAMLAFREPRGSLGILYSKTSKLELQVRALHPSHIPFISNSFPSHIPFISKSYPIHIPIISNSHPSHIQFISQSYPIHVLFTSQSYPIHPMIVTLLLCSLPTTGLQNGQAVASPLACHIQHGLTMS